MRTTDIRTARARVRLATTGVAVTGIVGVAAVAGGVAFAARDQGADRGQGQGASGDDQLVGSSGADPARQLPRDSAGGPGFAGPADPGRVSGGSAPAHGFSSGS